MVYNSEIHMINLEKELASIDDYFQRSKLYNKKVIRQSLLFTYDVFREYEKDCLSLSIMGTFLYDLNIILKSERYIAENIRSTVSPTIYADAYFNECKSLIFELERRAISPELKTMVAMNIAYLEDHYGASIEEYDKAQIHLNNCVDE